MLVYISSLIFLLDFPTQDNVIIVAAHTRVETSFSETLTN